MSDANRDPAGAYVQGLEDALRRVRLECLLSIRRAAFSPAIGVRYSETIRGEIAAECYRLERFIDQVLDRKPSRELEDTQAIKGTGS